MRIRSGMLPTVFAVWLVALLCLLACHYVLPSDAWITMLARPVSLVFLPLIVASIPLLAMKSEAEEVEDSFDAQRKPRWKRPGTLRKTVLIWLVSLIVFASPHNATPLWIFDSIFHNASFLIVAPLVLACISLLVSSSPSRTPGIRFGAMEVDSPSYIWRGLISSLLVAMLMILCLIGVHRMPGGGKVPVYCAITVMLSGSLWGLWKSLRQLRSSR